MSELIDIWYEVKTHDALLTIEHFTLVNQFINVFNVPEEVNEVCYMPLLRHYAECVQSLPLVVQGQSNSTNVAIKRVRAVMNIKRSGLKIQSKDRQGRLLFALFCSALLFEIGRVTQTRCCVVGNDEGECLRPWDPVVENINDIGQRFKVRLVQDRGKSYLTAITPLVATRLMPKLGLAWIHEDYQLFVSWTHALLRFEDAFEDWGLIYDLRDIYEYTKELALQEVSSTAVEGKHEAGEVFWQWLQDGISSGSLPLNQSDVGIYVVNGEIVLDHERVFRQFSSGFPQHGSWSEVAKQFQSLGIISEQIKAYTQQVQANSSSGFYHRAQTQAGHSVVHGWQIMQSNHYFKQSLLNHSSLLQQKSAADGTQTTRIMTAILGEMDQKFLPPKT